MEELGEEMIKWLYAHPDTLHLSEWYSIHKMFTYKQWDAMQQMPEFLPYYERALNIVGLKYLSKDSKVRDGISQRWQRVYFRDLRKQEDADKKDDIDSGALNLSQLCSLLKSGELKLEQKET